MWFLGSELNGRPENYGDSISAKFLCLFSDTIGLGNVKGMSPKTNASKKRAKMGMSFLGSEINGKPRNYGEVVQRKIEEVI